MLESQEVDASASAETLKNAFQKTHVMLDVKVKDESTNLDALAEKIMKIKKDGLTWIKEYKIVPLGNGGEKLRVHCEVDSDKVLADGIINNLEGYEKEIK